MHMYDDPGLEQQIDPEEESRLKFERQTRIDALGKEKRGELERRKRLKGSLEKEWINGEYAFEGEYTPSQSEEIKGTRTFVNITRPKSIAFAAHIADMLMPTDDKCYSVEARPKPLLAQTAGSNQPVSKTPEGAPVEMGDVSKSVTALSRERADAMELLIEDQFAQCKYNAEFRKALTFGAKYGTIIMRGPTKCYVKTRKWKQLEGATYSLDDAKGESMMGFSAVNPFHFYPDPAARTIEDSDGNFEIMFFTAKRLREMAKSGFNPDAIREVLNGVKSTTNPPDWYTKIGSINAGTTGQEMFSETGLYEAWLWSGELTGDTMVDFFGDQVDPELDSIPATLWGVGDIVIKAELSPMETGDCMYSVCPLIENEASLFGHGIPWAGRNAQESLNAAWRMVIDNAAASAVPGVVVDKTRIKPANGSWSHEPGKTWYAVEGADDRGEIDVRKMLQYIDFPVKLDQLMTVLAAAKEMFDEEVNFSLVMQGETGPNTPDTAQGTSIHYNAGRIVIKGLISAIDDRITVPNVGRAIDWNMQFSGDESIKGDHMPIAKGSSVLMERREQMTVLNGAMPLLLDERFDYMVDLERVLEEYLKNARLTNILREPEDRKAKLKEKQDAQAKGAQQPGDPARMLLAQIAGERLKFDGQEAQARLQLDAKIHEDDITLEAKKLLLDTHTTGANVDNSMQKLGIEKQKVGLGAQKLDSENNRFNTEASIKVQQGSGF